MGLDHLLPCRRHARPSVYAFTQPTFIKLQPARENSLDGKKRFLVSLQLSLVFLSIGAEKRRKRRKEQNLALLLRGHWRIWTIKEQKE